ncbi:hypothetical protein ACSNOI_40305 [Actinomadura kijaniata]|uniref:hypothetical protein n=1 Tax=Actinomadura kijaniata TaxID=46161 RepID=UPI003F1ABE01
MAGWPFRVEEVAVPVCLWCGGRDADPARSPDLGATLERRLPNARRPLLAEAGGGLLWTRAGDVPRGITSRATRR